MTHSLSWSINAGAPGGSLDASGQIAAEAIISVDVVIDPDSNKELQLQLADIDKVTFLALKSSIYGGKVKIKATGDEAVEIALTGPAFLFGEAVKLLGPSLEKLKITNTDGALPAEIGLVIATKVI